MRTATTQHLEPIRYFDSEKTYADRPPLNTPLLVTLLRAYLGNDEVDGTGPSALVVTEKKRAMSHEFDGNVPKRQKRSADDFGKGVSDPISESNLVPAFRHVYDFKCFVPRAIDADYVDDPTIAEKRAKQEEDLNNALKVCRSNFELGSLYLGEVSTFIKGPHILVSHRQASPGDALIVLPPLADEDFDLQADDYRATVGNLHDFMYCCHVLCGAGKLDISSCLKVDFLPHDGNTLQSELLFRMSIEVTLSLVCPAIFTGVSRDHKGSAGLDQRQRRVLNHFFPSEFLPPETFRGEIDIPFFYSILRPAPDLPSKNALEAVQPAALLPTLLPFQRRSVAWMLEREGKMFDEHGRIVPSVQPELPLFWEEVSLGGRKLYLHRLNGILSGDKPEVEIRAGGSLNEAPGLGKTVECIALILINPAIGRTPSIKHWDADARVFVKQIKTSLIITPSSLAPQWADELMRHSPSLKVFIYEGWSKLQGPITENDVEEANRQRLEKAIKGKRKALRVRKTSFQSSKLHNSYRNQSQDNPMDGMDVDNDNESQKFEDAGVEDDDAPILDWCSYINTFDVCITTYNVLQQDLTVARPPRVRPRREIASYTNTERPRSPLVMCEWYRVIVDEVQMAGGGKTEEMVSLIPRVSSFAVSGTPARSQVSDLIHVLKFLKVPEIADSLLLWKRLLKPNFVHHFVSLFRHYAIRTTKDCVKNELTIPTQTRFLVPIELGRVERHVYDQNMEQSLLELGYDARGVAAVSDWQVDASLLRTWLRTLRGFCTHPQVGQLQSQADKLHKPGVLKSISEVLDGMRDQNWRNFMDERKNKVQSLIRYSQLQQRDESVRTRYQHSLETLLLAEKEANQLVQELTEVIEDHDIKGNLLKKEATALMDSHNIATNRSLPPSPEPIVADNDRGKARASDQEQTEDIFLADDYSLDELPKTPAGEEHANKRRALQQRLRECHLVLHKVSFLKGDVYHVLGETYAQDENTSYSKAEQLRKRLLKSTEEAAMQAMKQMRQVTDRVTNDELLIPIPYLGQGGKKSSELMDEANELIEDILNAQTDLLWEWRTRLITLLTQSLSAESGEVDGEEYARTLDTQGEAETFLQAYSALLADRREVLLAERTLLALHDTREKTKRGTRTSKMAANVPPENDYIASITQDIELLPEHEILRKDLGERRKDFLRQSNGRAIKSVMVDLDGIAARIASDKDPEKVIIREATSALRQLINTQGKIGEKLEADLTQFRKTFNERVLYFRQLQEISDSVAEVESEGTLKDALTEAKTIQTQLEGKIKALRARQRYLNNLSRDQGSFNDVDNDDTCILCRCEFTTGYVTQCAHVFCETCLKAWLQRKEGKVCPVCRVIINPNQLQRFLVKTDEPKPPAPTVNNEPIPKSRREIQYNVIDDELFRTIESIESSGSYGSKIQMLVRHLLYLQITEPDAKSIVFSAWADSLHIIGHALHLNRIPALRIDQKKHKKSAAKVFQDDPDIRVLLLHGERENAGLNIICASRVFLVESVVNHAFEVQAIARIDRMGQTHNTQVYCYYAEDTIEKNILDLAARQGLSLYTKENSAGTLNVQQFVSDSKKVSVDSRSKRKKWQKGDFIFKTDDMLAILFPHMFEDTEYLIPDDDITMQEDSMGKIHSAREYVAEAGPSRSSTSI